MTHIEALRSRYAQARANLGIAQPRVSVIRKAPKPDPAPHELPVVITPRWRPISNAQLVEAHAVFARGRWTIPTADIIALVSGLTGISVADITGHSRFRHIARARQLVMYLAHHHAGRSYPHIGRHLGGKDHSTVLHGVRQVAANPARFEPYLSRAESIINGEQGTTA